MSRLFKLLASTKLAGSSSVLSTRCHPIFPLYTAQGGVEGRETLPEAAIRELLEEFGKDLDVWQTGKLPAAVYKYDLSKPTTSGQDHTKVC